MDRQSFVTHVPSATCRMPHIRVPAPYNVPGIAIKRGIQLYARYCKTGVNSVNTSTCADDTTARCPVCKHGEICACYGPTGRGTRTGHTSGTRNRHGGATRGR
eukprot:6121819-Prymnesium_polylepis.1